MSSTDLILPTKRHTNWWPATGPFIGAAGWNLFMAYTGNFQVEALIYNLIVAIIIAAFIAKMGTSTVPAKSYIGRSLTARHIFVQLDEGRKIIAEPIILTIDEYEGMSGLMQANPRLDAYIQERMDFLYAILRDQQAEQAKELEFFDDRADLIQAEMAGIRIEPKAITVKSDKPATEVAKELDLTSPNPAEWTVTEEDISRDVVGPYYDHEDFGSIRTIRNVQDQSDVDRRNARIERVESGKNVAVSKMSLKPRHPIQFETKTFIDGTGRVIREIKIRPENIRAQYISLDSDSPEY